MKNISLFIALFFMTSLAIPAGKIQAQSSDAPHTGVWKYELEESEGIGIISPTHFVWILTARNREGLGAGQAGIPEKAKAYQAMHAAAGTLELGKGNRVKATFLFHNNPTEKGTSFSYDFEREGDMLHFWIIQPDGSRGPLGKARKLADWNAKGDYSKINGVWEYAELNGLYLHSGDYGAWFILNGAQAGGSTDEAKAKNFDAVNSTVVIGSPRDERRQVWNVLHSVDPRQERAAYCTAGEFAANAFTLWFVDAKGAPAGNKFQLRRIGQ